MAGIKGLEDTLKLVEFVAVRLVKAKQAGTPLFDFVATPEFQAQAALVVGEAAAIPDEAMDLSLVEDLVLGKDIYNCVADIVSALKAKAA